METLKEYFLSNSDYSNLPNIFSNLSKELKVIHDNDMVVPQLDSEKIILDNGEFSFKYMTKPNNYELEMRKNITAFSKLMIGTYISLSTSFRDFSSVDDNWFLGNFDSILDSITTDGFDKEYFYQVFSDGDNVYYSDFLDKKRQKEELSGKGNTNSYKMVLANSASAFYNPDDEETKLDEKRSASINYLFYPLVLACFLIAFILAMIALNYYMK